MNKEKRGVGIFLPPSVVLFTKKILMQNTTLYVIALMLYCTALFSQNCCFQSPGFIPMLSYESSLNVEGTNIPLSTLENSIEFKEIVFYVQFFILNIEEEDCNSEIMNTALDNTNHLFFGANIRFAHKNKPKYVKIENCTINSMHSLKNIASKHYLHNVINIYIVPKIDIAGSIEPVGFAFHPKTPNVESHLKDIVVLSFNGIYQRTTLAHELGHYFGLLHTHEQTENGSESLYAEQVSRKNCLKTGDGICDTPADPNLYGWIDIRDNDCYFDAVMKDKYGHSYAPMIENVMSYADDACRTAFTKGQYYKIRQTALFDRNYLKRKKGNKKVGTPNDVERYMTIPAAYNKSKLTGGRFRQALVYIYKDSFLWSERMYEEFVTNPHISKYFTDGNKHSLVIFSVGEKHTSVIDFLGNEVFVLPQDENNEYNLLFRRLLPLSVRFPSVYLIEFFDYESQEFRIRDHHIGYLKPREIIHFIERNQRVEKLATSSMQRNKKH